MPEVKLFSKVHVHRSSKKADEVILRNHREKIEMVVTEFDVENEKRREVATINLDLKSARRVRAMLDAHIKMFES